MAKADGTTSTTDWIWLREALALAVAAFGSVALAKERLREWLAAGKVPWSCMWWKGLNAEDLAELKQEHGGFFGRSPLFVPSAAYYSGDPEFWNAGLKIDWEDAGAYELARLDGAQALGIKVSRAHLIARLPAISQSALAAPDEPASSPDRHGKAGAKPKYDWDAIQAHCHQWFDDNGYPENASKFCRDEIIPWCEQRYDESEIPDLETLRPYITRWIAASRRSLLPK